MPVMFYVCMVVSSRFYLTTTLRTVPFEYEMMFFYTFYY